MKANKTLILIFLISAFLFPDKLIAQYTELQNELEQEVNNQNFIRAQILLDSLTLTGLPAGRQNYYNGVINDGLYRFQQAASNFEKAVEIEPENVIYLRKLGETYSSLNNYRLAIKAYKQLLSLDPLNIPAMNKLAGLLLTDGQPENAIIYYHILLEKDSMNYYFHKQMGLAYSAMQQQDSAILHLQFAANLNPADASLSLALSKLYYTKQDYIAGISVLDNSLLHNPEKISLLKFRGLLNLQLKRADSAVADFYSVYKQHDTSAFTCKYLGISYYFTQEYDSASKYLTLATNLDSTDVENWFYNGIALSRAYYKKEGTIILEKTLEKLKPDKNTLADIYAELADNYFYFGDADKAAEMNQIALNYAPGKAILNYKLGNYYYNKKNLKKALDFYVTYLNKTGYSPSEALKKGEFNGSASDFVYKRIQKIREELFFEGSLTDNDSIAN
jgi:tetratricopeptide (TPR) repeat protein